MLLYVLVDAFLLNQTDLLALPTAIDVYIYTIEFKTIEKE